MAAETVVASRTFLVQCGDMSWITLAILTAFFYGVYNFFIKLSSGSIHQIVGAVILQVVAALLGAGVLLFLKITDTPLLVSSKGVWYAVLAGVFVGLAEITSFIVFAKGVPASSGIPVIIGGSVIFGVALGMIFLKEALTPLHYLAIAFIVIGVVLLAK